MSEITKLYENAGIKPFKTCEFCTQKGIDCLKGNINNITCGLSSNIYPPFTAEKQIALIKWLVQNKRLCIQKATYSNNFYMDTIIDRSNGVDSKNFEVCLASQINSLWQNLTEEERKQIKEILE